MQELEQDFKRDFFLNAQEAMDYGLSTAAILDDTCGNQIMIYQEIKK